MIAEDVGDEREEESEKKKVSFAQLQLPAPFSNEQLLKISFLQKKIRLFLNQKKMRSSHSFRSLAIPREGLLTLKSNDQPLISCTKDPSSEKLVEMDCDEEINHVDLFSLGQMNMDRRVDEDFVILYFSQEYSYFLSGYVINKFQAMKLRETRNVNKENRPTKLSVFSLRKKNQELHDKQGINSIEFEGRDGRKH